MRWIERREGENRVWNCLNLRCCAGHLLRHLPIDTQVMKFKTKYQTCLFLPSSYSLRERESGLSLTCSDFFFYFVNFGDMVFLY